MTNTPLTFPPGFLWGAATAAYQIEGAARRKRAHTVDLGHLLPHSGQTVAGDTGDVACDHVHRFRDDVALMAELGLKSYRFSIGLAAGAAGRFGPGQPGRAGLLPAARRRVAGRRASSRG